jgi:cardiolipin synthase
MTDALLGGNGLGVLIGVLHVALAAVVSAHIILTKEDVRAAIGWTGLVWLAPIIGSALYGLLGINRIRRSAGEMRGHRPIADGYTAELATAAGDLPLLPSGVPEEAAALATLVGAITGLRLTTGNAIEPLRDGDEAYPAMLEAIDAAQQSVGLATYIFDRGRAGDRFVDALARAVRRGAAVRVLIDGVGARYSHPPITGSLRRHGVTVARFLPSMIPIPHPYFNLRNHRKLLLVDGVTAFCGGMNIRDGCLLRDDPRPAAATQDVHFRVRGPVVEQLSNAFLFDWHFVTRERLEDRLWRPPLEPAGDMVARGIPEGPDEEFESLLVTLLGAISQATRSVRIVTPYFLPDPPVIDALRIAALRGVRVDIVLPERGNLRTVQWASQAQLDQVLKWGCRVHLSRAPFDHSKLMVVDGYWSLIGSANWDPRSLRLNFEYDLECYSTALASRLSRIIDAKIETSRPLTLGELQRRPVLIKLRDGVARLGQPYL